MEKDDDKKEKQIKLSDYSPTTIFLDKSASDILSELKNIFEKEKERNFTFSDVIRELKFKAKMKGGY